MSSAIKLVAVAIAISALTGCAVSDLHIADDYGQAYRQNMAAHIADPDAKYAGDPNPASDGQRADSAQVRYEKGVVTKPAATSTSTVSVGAGQ